MPNFEDSFRARGYRHFDVPPGLKGAKQLATNERRVEKHAFYPFIRRIVSTPRHNKPNKEREVDYASHADAAIYGWYGALLSERYETLLRVDGASRDTAVAYRKLEGQCNIHFAERAFNWVRDHLPCVVLCFDIEKFFNTLNHDLLKREWCKLLGVERLPRDHFQVFKSLTKYSFVHEDEIHRLFGLPKRDHRKRRKEHRVAPERLCSPQEFRSSIRDAQLIEPKTFSDRGIPQGSPMSGILSNIYMLPFDKVLRDLAASCGGFAQRYSDDVLLIVPPEWAEEAKRVVFDAAEERRLIVHREAPKLDERLFLEDCQAKPLPQPVQYLGFTFDGRHIRIRPQTLSRQCRKARQYLKYAAKNALSNASHPTIYRSTFQRRFTHRGKRNFGRYARRSAQVTSSPAVHTQWRNHGKRVQRWLEDFNSKNESHRKKQKQPPETEQPRDL